jgi:hypothetical protein
LIPASNDDCEGAIGPLSVDGSVTMGSTLNATYERVDCSDYNFFREEGWALGVWYSVIGTGEEFELSIGQRNPYTGQDTLATVFSGECGSLICYPGPIYSHMLPYVWQTEVGETYHIVVYDDDSKFHWAESPLGAFNISIMELPLDA